MEKREGVAALRGCHVRACACTRYVYTVCVVSALRLRSVPSLVLSRPLSYATRPHATVFPQPTITTVFVDRRPVHPGSFGRDPKTIKNKISIRSGWIFFPLTIVVARISFCTDLIQREKRSTFYGVLRTNKTKRLRAAIGRRVTTSLPHDKCVFVCSTITGTKRKIFTRASTLRHVQFSNSRS